MKAKVLNNSHTAQKRRFYKYLRKHTITCSMASFKLRISQKCLTRYKREMELAGVLWEVKIAPCKLTGCMAAYLTTNTDLVPKGLKKQLNLRLK